MTAREIIEAEDPKHFLRRVQAGKQAGIDAQVAQAWDQAVEADSSYTDAWTKALAALLPGADPAHLRQVAEFLNVRGMDIEDGSLWDDGTEVTGEEFCDEAMSHAFQVLPELTAEHRIAIETLWRSVYNLPA